MYASYTLCECLVCLFRDLLQFFRDGASHHHEKIGEGDAGLRPAP
jgi:hypothetical protein